MLIYGKRTAVDSALRSMVIAGEIFRLANGIFVRDLSGEPTIEEIVQAKLSAYRSKLAISAESHLKELALIPLAKPNTFAKNGSSSSFWTIRGRAYLQNVCERKMSLCQSVVGQFIYMLWFLYNWKPRLLPHAMRTIFNKLGRAERKLLWLASALMPSWLADSSRHIFPKPRVTLNNPFLS